MNQSRIKARIILILAMFLMVASFPDLHAQSYSDGSGRLLNDGLRYNIPAQNKTYVDLKVPQSAEGKTLYLRLEGADGGYVHSTSAGKFSKGGAGSTVEVWVPIGADNGQVPVGATLRFIIGEKGDNSTTARGSLTFRAAGAGGGTGIAFLPRTGANWQLLAVAGAGSGAIGQCWYGYDGRQGRGIVATVPSMQTGTGGHVLHEVGGLNVSQGFVTGGGGAFQAGEKDSSSPINGGEAGWVGGPDSGVPTGGNGSSAGGWGFGGGGGRSKEVDMQCTGGGGGYEGGSAIEDYGGYYKYNEDGTTMTEGGFNRYGSGEEEIPGDGGGSFYNEAYVIYGRGKTNGTTSGPGDGFVEYQFFRGLVKTVKFAYNINKCIDDYGSSTDNGNNILTYSCTGNPNQAWFFNTKDRMIHSMVNTAKCLDLTGANTINGTNIQLWDCVNSTLAQKWVYNGLYQTIHSGKNADKCFDAKDASKAVNLNVNLQLWDCNYSSHNQKWVIDGATTVNDVSNRKHIVPVQAQSFAVHSHTGAESGSNIQLWTKDNTNTAEQWYFDGLAIKMRDHQNLCIDLNQSNTNNGNNIQLYTCNSTNAQKWLYDGMTRSIRSVINPDKCMQIMKNSDGVYGKRSNVEIQDCDGSAAQQFLIE